MTETFETLKWCERCEKWFFATPRRCPHCGSKWAEMTVRATQEWDSEAPYPQQPPVVEET